MEVRINSVKFKADKNLELFIEDKLNKLDALYDGIIDSEVTLKVDNSERNSNKIVEIRVGVPGNDLYAKKQSESFEKSTDETVDALRRQVIRLKEKNNG